MARLNISLVQSGKSVLANVPRTLILYRSAFGNRVALIGLGVGARAQFGDDEPGLVELYRPSGLSAFSLTPSKLDDSLSETPTGTGFRDPVFEPNTLSVSWEFALHPQSRVSYKRSRSRQFINTSNRLLGLRVTFPQPQTVDAYLEFEE